MPILKGLVSALLLTLNTLFWGVPLILLTLLKLIVPGQRLKQKVLLGNMDRRFYSMVILQFTELGIIVLEMLITWERLLPTLK